MREMTVESIQFAKCPGCKYGKSTAVAEFNGLISLDAMRDSPYARNEFRLCHRCGIVFAAARPTGESYEFLYDNFNEFLGRVTEDNLYHYMGPLTDELSAEVDRDARPWWQGTEQVARNGDRFNRQLLKDIEDQHPNAAFLTLHVNLSEKRVLEIRDKTGFLADYIRRVGQAREVDVMTIAQVPAYVIQKLYGLRAEVAVNFEELQIPFEGKYDLVIGQHLLTHAIEPRRLLKTVRRTLRDNGVAFFCQENCDSRMFEKGKNLFGELKCFHFQQFDLESFLRVLRANAFEPIAWRYKRDRAKESSDFQVLAKKADQSTGESMTKEERDSRLDMYRRWRDESVLALPESLHSCFTDYQEVRQRAIAAGYADAEGRPTRRIKLMHGRGYQALNAKRAVSA